MVKIMLFLLIMTEELGILELILNHWNQLPPLQLHSHNNIILMKCGVTVLYQAGWCGGNTHIQKVTDFNVISY